MTLKPLFFLLGAIFVVSIAFSFAAHISPHADAKAYNHIGWNLARSIGYIEDEDLDDFSKDDAIFRVGPGYEFFLAGIYNFFESRAGTIYNYKPAWYAVWIAHAFLRALTAWFIYRIALLLFSELTPPKIVGLLAAAIFGFFPDLILINSFLLYETLLLFLSVTAVYFSLNHLTDGTDETNQTYLTLLTASLFWALTILTRPSELLPFLVFPVALIWQKRWRSTLISFLFPLLLVGGWSLRNSLLYDQPLFTTTAGAYALWVGNNEKATGGYDRPAELREARNTYHSTELSSLSMRRVTIFIKEHPIKFITLQARKTIMYFSLIRPTGFWPEFENAPGKRLIVVISSALATAFLFIAGAAGIWLVGKERRSIGIVLIGFMLAKPLAIIPLYIETRYRYSLYPLLALFAAFTIIALFTSPKHTGIKILGCTALIFFGITAIDAWYSLDIIINRLPMLFHAL